MRLAHALSVCWGGDTWGVRWGQPAVLVGPLTVLSLLGAGGGWVVLFL